MRKLIRNRKGQGLVEYGLIIAGVALMAAVGISVFGHKVSDMISAVAVILPGAHTGDNGPIVSGHLIETTDARHGHANHPGRHGMLSGNGTGRLGSECARVTAANGLDGLITETVGPPPNSVVMPTVTCCRGSDRYEDR